MPMIRAAVIGVGHLGRYHAEKYAIIDQARLVGVVDISRRRAETLAERLKTKPFFDYRDVIDQVDAVSIVVPTLNHYSVAKDFLEAGKHVLLEKPMTRTIEEAETLIELARRNNVVLQVGHLERFNPAMRAVAHLTGRPLFIEANRISPFPARGTDVDVVLDLMIHDIDIILHLAGEDPCAIQAVGVPVVTPRVDIANARMEFPGGLVANLNASRISSRIERKLRIFQMDAYLSIDFANKNVYMARRQTPPQGTGLPVIAGQEITVDSGDALETEIRAFLTAISDHCEPEVCGEDGRRALDVALKIMSDIKARQGDWFDNREALE
jgi:predicted dehydrogenase